MTNPVVIEPVAFNITQIVSGTDVVGYGTDFYLYNDAKVPTKIPETLYDLDYYESFIKKGSPQPSTGVSQKIKSKDLYWIEGVIPSMFIGDLYDYSGVSLVPEKGIFKARVYEQSNSPSGSYTLYSRIGLAPYGQANYSKLLNEESITYAFGVGQVNEEAAFAISSMYDADTSKPLMTLYFGAKPADFYREEATTLNFFLETYAAKWTFPITRIGYDKEPLNEISPSAAIYFHTNNSSTDYLSIP